MPERRRYFPCKVSREWGAKSRALQAGRQRGSQTEIPRGGPGLRSCAPFPGLPSTPAPSVEGRWGKGYRARLQRRVQGRGAWAVLPPTFYSELEKGTACLEEVQGAGLEEWGGVLWTCRHPIVPRLPPPRTTASRGGGGMGEACTGEEETAGPEAERPGGRRPRGSGEGVREVLPAQVRAGRGAAGFPGEPGKPSQLDSGFPLLLG